MPPLTPEERLKMLTEHSNRLLDGKKPDPYDSYPPGFRDYFKPDRDCKQILEQAGIGCTGMSLEKRCEQAVYLIKERAFGYKYQVDYYRDRVTELENEMENPGWQAATKIAQLEARIKELEGDGIAKC